MKTRIIFPIYILFLITAACKQPLPNYARWQLIEISMNGPESLSTGDPNPFGIDTDVIFTAPSGKNYSVPAFYDGDGKGGPDGTVWKVRFSADENGKWIWISQSTDRKINSVKGSFLVTDPGQEMQELYRWGRLEAVGTPENGIRYLKFREGPFWLKAGCDDPENFLGNLENYNTIEKRKSAVDYLASKGINSLYIMTHTIDGDGRDVWPWLGDTQEEAKKNGMGEVRFHIARLKEWFELFQYMQSRGMVVYMVLEDDSAWKGYDHKRYYREMIARFGNLPGLIFNINEEHNENYTDREALNLSGLLKEMDPYHHPIGIHNFNRPDRDYILSPSIDFTSIQTGTAGKTDGLRPEDYQRLVSGWLDSCRLLKARRLMVGIDEGRPECDRRSWWTVYLSGGVWEAHVTAPYDRPMSAWDSTWTQLGGTRKFMESVSFEKFNPDTTVVKKGKGYCLSDLNGCYLLYLPEGGPVTIQLPAQNNYKVEWWNPDNGTDGNFQNPLVLQGGEQTLQPPSGGDWALRITAEKQN